MASGPEQYEEPEQLLAAAADSPFRRGQSIHVFAFTAHLLITRCAR